MFRGPEAKASSFYSSFGSKATKKKSKPAKNEKNADKMEPIGPNTKNSVDSGFAVSKVSFNFIIFSNKPTNK